MREQTQQSNEMMGHNTAGRGRARDKDQHGNMELPRRRVPYRQKKVRHHGTTSWQHIMAEEEGTLSAEEDTQHVALGVRYQPRRVHDARHWHHNNPDEGVRGPMQGMEPSTRDFALLTFKGGS